MENNKSLLENGAFSDVTFIVGKDGEEERIKGHRCILFGSSSVFHSLFLESGNEIRILDINPTTFKALLNYIYINEEPELNEDNWAALLYAGVKYEITALQKKCIVFVKKNLFNNLYGFFVQARKNQVDNLIPSIKKTITLSAELSLTSNSFMEIDNNELLNEILSLDLHCKEIIIFRSALKWALSKIKNKEEQNGTTIRRILGPALYAIRFPRLSLNEFNREVIPKGILTDEEILSILTKKDSCRFSSDPRGDNLLRFADFIRGFTTTKSHSIKFKVDKKVQVYAVLIYRPYNSGNVLKGIVFITDEQNVILGKTSFKINYDKMEKDDICLFGNPFWIDPNKWYTASVEFELTPVETWMGINGYFEVKKHGVKLSFGHVSSSKETNEFEGQIPGILFKT